MPSQLGIPASLRRYGLSVELVPGWETRGSTTFNPRGVVCHWTAGPKTGDRPSLRICINGRPDLPGPLCQVFLTRAGVAVVVSANRANHAGSGGYAGASGNASVFGIEAESARGEWTDAQRWAYPRVVAALRSLCAGPRFVCGHNEWAPSRKVDIATYTMAVMRAQVDGVDQGGKWTTLDEPTLVALQRLVGTTPDGVWGPNTARAVQTWLGVRADGVFGPDSITALQRRVGASADGVWGPETTAKLTDYIFPPAPAPVPEEDIMASIDDLRSVIRQELRDILDTPITVARLDGTSWVTSPARGLAAAAETQLIRLEDGTVVSIDDAVAELLADKRAREATEAEEAQA